MCCNALMQTGKGNNTEGGKMKARFAKGRCPDCKTIWHWTEGQPKVSEARCPVCATFLKRTTCKGKGQHVVLDKIPALPSEIQRARKWTV